MPGAHDAVNRRDSGGAVGQSRHGLGAADTEDLTDPCPPGRRQHEGVQDAVWRGHTHGDAANAGHARRDGVHQHRGGIGRLAAWYVDSDAVQRRPTQAHGDAVVIVHLQVGGALGAVEGLDAAGGGIERVVQVRRYFRHRGVDLVGRDAQSSRGNCHAIEPGGVTAERFVAAGAYVGDDRGNGCVHARRGLAGLVEQGVKSRGEIGRGGG